MSHITHIETKIQFKDWLILRQALQALGEVRTEIHDHYNNKQTVDMSLWAKEFPKGIGFKKQGSGEYSVLMDDYGYVTQAHNLLNKISQKYIQLYATRAAQHQGFRTQETTKENGHVQLFARRY